MTVTHLEILVEEESMERALAILVPKMLQGATFQIYTHRGKFDLIRKLPGRLRAYRTWLHDTWRILILIDRDENDCIQLKKKIDDIAIEAGFGIPSKPRNGIADVLTRIVVEELEAWYFGDWTAVTAAYPRVPSNLTAKASYRNPDEITGGTWEAFERELKKRGYFTGGLQKLAAASAIAAHMDPERNVSPSFQLFRQTLSRFCST